MFRLSSRELTGRRILLIEDDAETARALGLAIREAGGSVVAVAVTVEDGLHAAHDASIDQALLHIRYTCQARLNIPEAFARLGIETVFIACFDDWFDFDNDVEETPARMAL